jgi:hypothetical protein
MSRFMFRRRQWKSAKPFQYFGGFFRLFDETVSSAHTLETGIQFFKNASSLIVSHSQNFHGATLSRSVSSTLPPSRKPCSL